MFCSDIRTKIAFFCGTFRTIFHERTRGFFRRWLWRLFWCYVDVVLMLFYGKILNRNCGFTFTPMTFTATILMNIFHSIGIFKSYYAVCLKSFSLNELLEGVLTLSLGNRDSYELVWEIWSGYTTTIRGRLIQVWCWVIRINTIPTKSWFFAHFPIFPS